MSLADLDDIRVTYTWRANHDGKACYFCEHELDRYTWTSNGVLFDELVHPDYGKMWDFRAGHSWAHRDLSCRCGIDVDVYALSGGDYVDIAKARIELAQFMNELEEAEVRAGALGLSVGAGGGGAGAPSTGRQSNLLLRTYQLTTYPNIAGRMMRGQATSYDILRIIRRFGGISGALAGYLPLIGVGLMVGGLVARAVGERAEAEQRPILAAQNYIMQQSRREYFRMWNP